MALDIIARLKLSGADFSRQYNAELNQVEAKARSTSARISNTFGKAASAATGFIAAIGVTTIAAVAKDALDFAASLGETASQLGVTTKFMQEFRFAATQSGASTEEADNALSKFTLTLGKAREGGKAQTQVFRDLGVSLSDANGKARESDAVYRDVAEAISKIEDPTVRAKVAQEAFGKGYKAIIPLLEQGAEGFALSAKEAREFGLVISDEDIQKADATADKIDKLQSALQIRVASVVAENSEAIGQLTEKLLGLATAAVQATSDYFKFADAAEARAGKIQAAYKIIDKMDAPIGLRNMAKERAFNIISDRDSEVTSEGSIFSVRRPKPTVPKTNYPSPKFGTRQFAVSAQQLAVDDFNNLVGGLTFEGANDLEPALIKAAKPAREIAINIDAVRDALEKMPIDTFSDIFVKAGAESGRLREEQIEQARVAQEEVARQQDIANDRQRAQVGQLADYFEAVFSGRSGDIFKDFKAQGRRAIAELGAQFVLSLLGGGKFDFNSALGGILGGGAPGSAFGGTGAFGGLLGSLGGGGLGGGAGALGGGLAGLGPAGLAIGLAGLTLGGGGGNLGALGAAAGGFAVGGPLGALVGLGLGTLAGSLKSTKRGSATLGFGGGDFSATNVRGNSSSRKETSISGVNAVGDTLRQIADALGAQISGAGSVSVGVRKKTFVVDPTGQGRTKGKGVLKFKNEEAAIRAATSEALRDGVLTGISDAAKAILQSGQKLETAIEKAVLIDSIPKALKSRLDPLGSAIDELNAKWDKTIAALNEGGASVAQIADAQRLYALELDEVKASTRGASADLKDFLDQFKVGANSPFSLPTQLANAQKAVDPLFADIDAGRAVNVEKFVIAAQALYDTTREIEGGTAGTFATLDKIRDYTERAIAKIEGGVSGGAARDPFAALAAKAAESTATNTLATAEMMTENNNLLRAIFGKLESQGLTANDNAFIGSIRSFG
jgi:hypothetical protein